MSFVFLVIIFVNKLFSSNKLLIISFESNNYWFKKISDAFCFPLGKKKLNFNIKFSLPSTTENFDYFKKDKISFIFVYIIKTSVDFCNSPKLYWLK